MDLFERKAAQVWHYVPNMISFWPNAEEAKSIPGLTLSHRRNEAMFGYFSQMNTPE